MYPDVVYGTTTHDLCQGFSPGGFHSQKISNGLVSFAGGVKVRASNDKRYIAYAILYIFGIGLHWSVKNQSESVSHYIDSEVCTFYLATKMVQCLRPILQNLGLQVSGAPTPIYDYSSPNIDNIKANHITIRVKHIHGHINYFYERYVLLTVDPIKLKATIQY